MKYNTPYQKILSILFILCFAFCNNKAVNNSTGISDKDSATGLKPPSTFQDSLIIDSSAVVFYSPDSMQMVKIKAITEEGVYNSTTHEYIYQIRNANIFLKNHWPNLKIIDANNLRFLVFIKNDGSSEVVDLNTKDPYGMIVFDQKQAPLIVDMMNVDTQVTMYFKN